MAPRTPQKRTLGWRAGLDLEEFEEQDEDEEVVDGEGLFEGVAGEVLDGGLKAESGEDEEGEGQGGGDPEDGGDDGGGVGSGFGGLGGATAGVEQLGGEEQEDEDVEADPVADGGGAGHVSLMLSLYVAGDGSEVMTG